MREVPLKILLANGFLCMEGEIGRLRFALGLGLGLDSHRLIKGEDENKTRYEGVGLLLSVAMVMRPV